MTDEEQKAFETEATHLGYNVTRVGEKYSLYTDQARKLWEAAIRYAATEHAGRDGLRQERPGT